MEHLDQETQRRVWQRVQSRDPVQMPQLPVENVKTLLLTARENLAAYTWLQKQMGMKHREAMNGLVRETRKSIACLQGIGRLQGEPVRISIMKPVPDHPRRTLEKCYHRERKLWDAWQNRREDPEFGVVFHKLSRQAREHCAVIMEILGQMDPGK